MIYLDLRLAQYLKTTYRKLTKGDFMKQRHEPSLGFKVLILLGTAMVCSFFIFKVADPSFKLTFFSAHWVVIPVVFASLIYRGILFRCEESFVIKTIPALSMLSFFPFINILVLIYWGSCLIRDLLATPYRMILSPDELDHYLTLRHPPETSGGEDYFPG